MAGVRTTDFAVSNTIDALLGNRGGNTVAILIERLVALVAALMGPTYGTRAALYADLAWPVGAIGYVRADPTPALNGVYKKAGASGTGSWSRIGDLPSGAVEASQLAALEAAMPLKAPLASPALTGTPTAPTAAPGTNTTQIASTAFVRAAVDALLAAAPGALDTLNELAAALGNDANFAATMTTALAAKASVAALAAETAARLAAVVQEARDPWAAAIVDSTAGAIMAAPAVGRPHYRGLRDSVMPTLLHVPVYGQSNSLAAEAFPPSTPVAGDDLMQFQRGFQTWELATPVPDPETRPAEDFQLSPLIGTLVASKGQSFAVAFGRALKRHLSGGRFGSDTTDAGSLVLFSNAGAGSQYLRTLGHWDALGSKHYAYMLDDIARARALAEAWGLRYQVLALLFDQGENEALGGWNPLDTNDLLNWEASRVQYRDDLAAFVATATPAILTAAGDDPARPLPWFVRQMHRGSQIAQAQLDVAALNPNVFVAGPGYLATSAINSDLPVGASWATGRGSWVHFTADGQNVIGGMLWRAARKVLFENRPWKPLAMCSAERISNTQIRVRFDVPVKPIRLDSSLTHPRTDKGLRVCLGVRSTVVGGDVRTITAVAVTGEDELTITLDPGTPVAAGATAFVEACHTQEIGTLPAVITVRDGAAYPSGLATKEIVVSGNQVATVLTWLKFGAIRVRQSGSITFFARDCYLDGANTVLRGHAQHLVGTFAAGTGLTVDAPNHFTNIIDSDDTLPQGAWENLPTRAGEPYPSANPCCAGVVTITT